ncbi:MAG: hypothetical protein AAF721_30745 [Myxococcota bacterium]
MGPLSLVVAAGCGVTKDLGVLDTEGSEESGTGDTMEPMDSATSMGEGDDSDTGIDLPPASPSGAVDILFVVDNSGSMGGKQGLLAGSFFELTEPLMQAGIQFRVAVTTSDNSNPWCPGTTPEGGYLVLSSCQSRLDEFVFSGSTMTDASQEACLDVCALPSLDIAPTTTHVDPTAFPRPWVEWNSPEDLNTPGLAPSAVLSCALPTGINGCGFEQPLESMYRALNRAQNAADPSFGFLRPDANLLVVFVTDEADCSYNPAQETIFLPEDERTFWSYPEDPTPTSAVCWNAGVQCSGVSPFDTCEPADLAPDGSPALTGDEASLWPVSRYAGLLGGIAATKTAGRVAVMAFVGTQGNGSIVYSDTTDEGFQGDFGIGPGCDVDGTQAVPPVRLRAVANAVNGGQDEGLFSVCGGSYGPALTAMAETIIGWAD